MLGLVARHAVAAVLLIVVAGLLGSGAEAQKRKRGKVPKVETSQVGSLIKLQAESGAVGFFHVPKGLPAAGGAPKAGAERPGLLVVLHGHGSTATNMMQAPLADAHGDYMLSVQGRSPTGNGFGWDVAPGTADINDLVRWSLAGYPIDPQRVVLIGHSAGGTMVLQTFPTAPKLYAGLITVAAPQTPSSAHKSGRVCVFLGTADPNFAGATSVRSALGGKRKWKSGCLVVLEGAEHNNLPNPQHMLLAVDWCLAGKAYGAEASVPHARSGLPPQHAYRVIVIGHKDVADWDDPRCVERKKGKARKLAATIAKAMGKKKAFFALEALAYSDHDGTFSRGGLIDEKGLTEIDPSLAEAAKALEPGTASKVIETPKGYVILWREAESK